MKLHRQISLAGLLLLLPASAFAQPKPKPINLSAVLDKLWVLQGDGGHQVLVLPPWEREAAKRGGFGFSGVMMFGKNRVYYRQHIRSSSANGTKRFSRSFIDNRVPQGGELIYNQGVIKLRCGKRETTLKLIEGERRKRILQGAKFYSRYWLRQSVTLARDNLAQYYYVDRLSDAAGGQGYRLFVGPKGALKRVPLVDVAIDSEGSVFATRKGSLVLAKDLANSTRFSLRYKVKWVYKNNKEKPLRFIPPSNNALLIYRDLGVYAGKRFGTPCDVY